ncbi:hypothetical protein [Dyadobacter sp. CY343]|uniref:hypothetical protein n=1 Tax=Dyadobacter sp. CY343 TaxID=2907299 RepID=UPI001F29FC30|nr:hypothetical protein [Dyadobacter sp. CY343]MCE7063085.1 hypothetical protein [Dyadobacter sp. CY343]
MHSISLKHTTIFDRFLHLCSHAPAIGNALPSLAINKLNAVYQGFLNDLGKEQRAIHDFTLEDALLEKKRYEKALKLLAPIETAGKPVQPKVKALHSTILQVIKKLRENAFLMNLVINQELEPEDTLVDLLEDYYDGLLIKQRQGEEFVPWEQVKTKLDARHDLT